MAKPRFSTTTLVALLLCFLLLASIEMQTAEAKVCKKLSRTWSGPCHTGNCNHKCKHLEKSLYGACEKRHHPHFGFACFCYYKC